MADGPLNPQRELFCRYYTQNEDLFGNATHSYAEAYDYKLDTLSHEAIYDLPEGNKDRKKIQDSEYERAIHVCAVEGSRLLRSPEVQSRITALLNEILRDEVVDSQLAKLIMQDSEPAAKIAAIREYNKIRQRIVDKTDITSGGKPITGFNFIKNGDNNTDNPSNA
jgi:hypothetical protein